MKSLIKKFFKNLFRNILGQKEETSRKEKSCEKQDSGPIADIKDGGRIKNLTKDAYDQDEITKDSSFLKDAHDQDEITEESSFLKDVHDQDEITKDSSFFIENFPKYKPEENKDESYGEQIKNRRRQKKSVKPQEELDLHGMTSDEALMRLKSFIEGSRRKGLEQVLIIVGKGNHSEGGKSVLHPIVETWLKGEGKTQTSKYKNAPPKLGGSGAIQVWLK
jgi:DNA-nicking Smr family endonuclease